MVGQNEQSREKDIRYSVQPGTNTEVVWLHMYSFPELRVVSHSRGLLHNAVLLLTARRRRSTSNLSRDTGNRSCSLMQKLDEEKMATDAQH